MKRRRFLTTTLAGVSLASLSFAQTTPRRLKVAQIGTQHGHAEGQISTVRSLADHFEVVGFVEEVEEDYQRFKNLGGYRNIPRLKLSDMLAMPEIDVVAIETDPLHSLPYAQKCVDAGKHIHLDKPGGASFPALQRLHETAQEKSLTIQMGYMYRYNPAFQFMFKAVTEGWLGNIFEIHTVMSKTIGENARKELAAFPGGSMFELGCHLIDPIVNMLGKPDNVVPFNRKTKEDGLLDNTFAVLEYPKATVSVRSALVEVDGFRRRQFYVCGDAGTIVINRLDKPTLELTLSEPRGKFKKGTQMVDLPKSQGRYHGAWLELAQVLRGNQAFPFSHQHDLDVQRVLLAASGMKQW